ncbi:MAG: hypothetical protein P8X57_05850 [Cyclobacteriaceae bacterium]
MDREKFSFDDPSLVDAVTLEHREAVDTLSFVNGLWRVNNTYKADPQRISVLFAILKQARVRRRAALSQIDSLSAWMDENSVRATFYEGNEPVITYEVAGNISNGLTYYREASGEPIYLMEIPGYRSYLAGIYELDEFGWRYPRVFDFNWSTLKDVEVDYPSEDARGFRVSFEDNFFQVEELPETDTTRIADFLDDLSLLYVNDYLFQEEVEQYDSLSDDLTARITVRDVGDNAYLMEVLEALPGETEILVRLDSSDYALADFEALRKILRPRRYFVKKDAP